MKTLLVLAMLLITSIALGGESADQPGVAPPNDSAAVITARAYLRACDSADVDALNALFLDGGRATVLENAGDEGTWEHYRDHHLLPELAELRGIRFALDSEAEQVFGTTSIVRHIGSFTIPNPNSPNEPRKILSAVTYVVVTEAGKPKIAHLHWSSRAARAPTTQPGR